MMICRPGPSVSPTVPLPEAPSDVAATYVSWRVAAVVPRFASVSSVENRAPPTPETSRTMGTTFVTVLPAIAGATVTVCVFVFGPAAFVTVSETWYEPAAANVCVGYGTADTPPSPKVHDHDVGIPVERSVKPKGCPATGIPAHVKSATAGGVGKRYTPCPKVPT